MLGQKQPPILKELGVGLQGTLGTLSLPCYNAWQKLHGSRGTLSSLYCKIQKAQAKQPLNLPKIPTIPPMLS